MIMKKVFLGLGTNMGNRAENLRKAFQLIEIEIGPVLKASSLYETEQWGFHSEELFLNMVVGVETELTPSGLMAKILSIETLLGRERGEKQYVSRVIDIDILLYEDQIIQEKNLNIPHQLMHERSFVLVPLCEIEPELLHPVLEKSIRDLLKVCKDKSEIRRL